MIDIQALKIQFIEEFLRVSDERIVLKLAQVLHEEQQHGKKYELTPEELDAVEEGLLDLKKGTTYSHDEVMLEMNDKYPDLFK